MDQYELTAKYNIAETCCASISITDLCALSSAEQDPATLLDIRGLPELRSNLAALYSVKTGSRLPPDNVLITPGAIAANNLLFFALVGPGDHVICHYPTYQQLYSIPASLGAEVDLWRARPEKGWMPDIEELKALVKPNTKLIVIKYEPSTFSFPAAPTNRTTLCSNPNNPTGAILKRSLLQDIINLASENSITILSDEVYRPLFHGTGPMDPEFPPSIISLAYANTIATGSLSKAYSLAGLRVGWIASRSREIIEKVAAARDYTTISVSHLDQQVAAFALSSSTISGLLGRNIRLAKTNLELLEKFVEGHRWICEWVKPVAGTTAFVRFHREGKPVDDVQFCRTLQEQTGVMFMPGAKGFGEEWKGYVRIGYVNETEVVREGLKALEKFVTEGYKDVPTC